MKTCKSDSYVMITKVKLEPDEIATLTQKSQSSYRCSQIESDSTTIKKENDGFVPSAEVTVTTFDEAQSTSSDMRIKYIDNQFDEQERASESDSESKICKVCEKTFFTQTDLFNHKKNYCLTIHDKNNDCKMRGKNLYAKDEDANYKCEICTKCFAKKIYLSRHMKTHTNEKNYKCEICSKYFTANCHLLRHIKVHTGERNIYKCDICSKCFAEKWYLSMHIKIHTGERNYKCDICNKIFASGGNLLIHMNIHNNKNNYKCEICTRRFTLKQNMLRHMKIHTNERNYKCQICAKSFVDKWYMLAHMKIHTGESNYKCDTCTKYFISKKFMLRHMKMHTGERNFKCKICTKAYIEKWQLLKHMKVHSGERNCKCEICTKSFRTKRELSQHLKMHANEKKYECNVCFRNFDKRRTFLTHKKTHNGSGKIKKRLFKEETNTAIAQEKMETIGNMARDPSENTNNVDSALDEVKAEVPEFVDLSQSLKIEVKNEPDALDPLVEMEDKKYMEVADLVSDNLITIPEVIQIKQEISYMY